MTRQSFVIMLLAAFSTVTYAQRHWNQFRGPAGDGITDAKELPTEFSETENVRWKVAIPGEGWSSPVVWGKHVWLTSAKPDKGEFYAICVELESGRVTKQIKVFEQIETPRNEAYAFRSPHLNSPATPTPVVENGRIYVHFGSQGTACIDTESGKKIWERRDLHCDHVVRPGSSPIVDKDTLYVAYDGIDKQFFVALHKTSGKTKWRKERNVDSDWGATLRKAGIDPSKTKKSKPGDHKKSYATAHLIELNGRRQLIAPAAEATIAYDPSDGTELWRVYHLGGFNVAARPIFSHGLIYVFTSGLTGHLLAIKPDGEGDVTESHVAWSTKRSTPHIPSPVLTDDAMYFVTQKGIARCLEPTTGKELWKKRVSGSHWASPLLAGNRLYFSSKDGEVTVLDILKPDDKPIRNQLNAEIIASPAVAGKSLLIRSTTHLYCLAKGFRRSPAEAAADLPVKRKSGNGEDLAIRKLAARRNVTPAQAAKLLRLRMRLTSLVTAGKLTRKQAEELFESLLSQQTNR